MATSEQQSAPDLQTSELITREERATDQTVKKSVETAFQTATENTVKLPCCIDAEKDEIYQADQEEADFNDLSTEADSDAMRGDVDSDSKLAIFKETSLV